MKPKDIAEIRKRVEDITVREWRNPEIVAELIKLNVLLGDILATRRTPKSTYTHLNPGERFRFTHRRNKLREVME